MKLGIIADDFTGASDIGLTLAEGGMTTVQYVGIPNGAADAGVDAGVVALKSRTIPVADAIAQSLAACDWLLAQGCSQIIYKVCSTFDSTDAGNIGQVTQALAEKLGETHVFVCPAFPENGRAVYMGHLFVGDVLLSDSGMRDHPLTPMRDADLRRVLGRQTDWDVAHVPFLTVAKGAGAVVAALPATPAMVVIDAIRDDDLRVLAQAVRDRKLMTGGSGIAIGLPANFGAVAAVPDWDAVTGKGAVLSGSCSVATRGQVAAFSGPRREITPDAAMAGLDIAALAEWVVAQEAAPLVYSSADPAEVLAAQDKYGRDAVAHAIEGAFTALTAALVARGITRLVVAGGETSGAAVAGLDAKALAIGPRLAAGVPMLRPDGRNLAVALKSGNFGAVDFFETALARMAQ